jgi:hypothetical protein
MLSRVIKQEEVPKFVIVAIVLMLVLRNKMLTTPTISGSEVFGLKA